MNGDQQRERLYGLEGIRLDAYDAIVQPDVVFAVRIYTLRRWVPILGTSGFWLLVALQQQCYRNPRGADWCVVSREALARESGLSEATVHRYLHGEYADSGLCHWVQLPDSESTHRRRQWSSRAGRMTQAPNCYTVVMDAPLAPVDQRGLAQFLTEQGAAPGVSSAEIEPVLEQLAGRQLGDLLDLLDECASRFQPPASWDEHAFYPTVADVVLALGIQINGGDGEGTRFLDLCSKVQQALVGQVYLGTQYFRQKWVPLLGHKLGMVVMQLRSMCFWNESERRDAVKSHFTTLAHVSCCSARFLRNDEKQSTSWSRQFYTVENPGRGRRESVFHVMLLEPIAPQDENEYRALLNTGVVAETGQLVLPELDSKTEPVNALELENGTGEHLGTEPVNALEMENGTGERLGTEPVNALEMENGTGERLGTEPVNALEMENGTDERLGTEPVNVLEMENGTGERLGTEPVNALEMENGTGERLGTPKTELANALEMENGTGERLGMRENGTGEQHISTIIISTHPKKALKKQKHANDPAATASLLKNFGIVSPADSRILARGPDSNDVRAWMLYTLTQPGLDDLGVACGFVVNRLLDDAAPPDRFRRWARLTPDQWQALWRADHYAGPYRASLPPDLAEALDAWPEDFDTVFPDGPFGDGLLDESRLRSALAGLGEPPGGFDLVIRRNTTWLVPDTSEVGDWLRSQVTGIQDAWAHEGMLHQVAIAPVEPPEVDDSSEMVLSSPSSSPGGATASTTASTRGGAPLREYSRGRRGGATASTRGGAAQVWRATLVELQLQMTQATFDSWLRDSRLLELEDGVCVVEVKSDYAKDWLEHRLLSTIERTLIRVIGRTVELKFVVRDTETKKVEVGAWQ